MLLERKDEQTAARCPFCHDGLEAAGLVECDSCRAVYHDECVERCVVLGCQGTLASASGETTPRRAVLRVDLRTAPPVVAVPRSPRAARALRVAFLLCFAAFVAFLALSAAAAAPKLVFPAVACFAACVALAQGEVAGPESPERVREREAREARRLEREAAQHLRVAARGAARASARAPRPDPTPVEPPEHVPLFPPAPPPLAFPSMFGAPPTEGGAGGVDDEARRRITARRDARRPGGLGRTL